MLSYTLIPSKLLLKKKNSKVTQFLNLSWPKGKHMQRLNNGKDTPKTVRIKSSEKLTKYTLVVLFFSINEYRILEKLNANLSQINNSFFQYREQMEREWKNKEQGENKAKTHTWSNISSLHRRIYTVNTVFTAIFATSTHGSTPARITMALISEVAKKLLCLQERKMQ